MTNNIENKYPTPFSSDEREILKKWSNLSKSKKLLTPFQRKILYAIENYGLSIKKANLGYRSLDRFNKKNTLQKLKFQIEKI